MRNAEQYDLYHRMKGQIKDTANHEHKCNPRDKARVRYVLNNLLDELTRELSYHAMKEIISEAQANLFGAWLENYTCKRHTKIKEN